jgi:hypothetical protein
MKKSVSVLPATSLGDALKGETQDDGPPRTGGSWSKDDSGQWLREGTVTPDPFAAPQEAVEPDLKKD